MSDIPRNTLIKECAFMEAELNGVQVTNDLYFKYDKMTYAQLEKEFDWLYDMVFLK
jgi:hypothetical protein